MTEASISHVATLADGAMVHAHTIGGTERPVVRVLTLGATVASLHAFAADSTGQRPNIVLGHRDPTAYSTQPTAYLGATVGRYANRIAGARFQLNEHTYVLPANEGRTCLHGGPGGFHSRIWTAIDAGPDTVTLEVVSADGDQGFPGALTARVTYRVTDTAVHVDITATTTAPTVVNLTNHTYWNLAGEGRGSIDDHLLSVHADTYLPIDDHSIPLGDPHSVDSTPLDLRQGSRIGDAARAHHPQTAATRGLDHCYLIDGVGMRRAALLTHPPTRRKLELFTDQPTLQVYTGNYLDGTIVGPAGRRYRQGDGLALEPQLPPDAPNRRWHPTPVLEPGDTYRSTIEWRFSQ